VHSENNNQSSHPVDYNFEEDLRFHPSEKRSVKFYVVSVCASHSNISCSALHTASFSYFIGKIEIDFKKAG
jgi:hypothetical protein